MLRPYLQMWLGQVIKIINKKSRNELHPKSQTEKSNFWGVFIMKLTYEDKVQIYELRKQGESFKRLSNQFGVNVSCLKYMVKLIDRYGINIIKKGKNRYYSPKLKREMIDKVLLEGCSQQSVCLDYGLSN